jgi:hypothetical protein
MKSLTPILAATGALEALDKLELKRQVPAWFYEDLTKAERKGKTPAELQALRKQKYEAKHKEPA